MKLGFGARKPEPVSQKRRQVGTLTALGPHLRHIVEAGLNAFPKAKVTMFEPQADRVRFDTDLGADRQVEFQDRGVGDIDGHALFSLAPRDDSSSFVCSPEEAQAQGFNQGQIEICRLDIAMSASGFGWPDIFKIDAEGLDLNVHNGGRETMSLATIVLVRATAACPTYRNTAVRVCQKMDELSFRPLDITDMIRSPKLGLLWLIEAAFVRKDAALAQTSTNFR